MSLTQNIPTRPFIQILKPYSVIGLFLFTLLLVSLLVKWVGTENNYQTLKPLVTFTNDTISIDRCPKDSITIRHGYFYGECMGYCETEYRIHKQQVEQIRRSHQLGYPTKNERITISKIFYDSIVQAVPLQTIALMEDQYGCPDCNDGGGEWIYVETSDFKKRITLEAGTSLTPIQPLLNLLREVDRRFEKINSHD